MNPYLEAVIETNPDALEIAQRLDDERARGKVRGPLHGIPVLVKDVGGVFQCFVVFVMYASLSLAPRVCVHLVVVYLISIHFCTFTVLPLACCRWRKSDILRTWLQQTRWRQPQGRGRFSAL